MILFTWIVVASFGGWLVTKLFFDIDVGDVAFTLLAALWAAWGYEISEHTYHRLRHREKHEAEETSIIDGITIKE